MLHRGIGVLVRGDFQPFAPGFFQLLNHLANAPPVGFGAHFQMVNMNRDLRFPRHAQHLGQLFHHIEAFAADMDAIVAAVTFSHFRHFDDFAGILRSLGMPSSG
jgi:hypothetical protein